MATIYISIGSNIEPRQHIELALTDLRSSFTDVRASSLYESESVGFDGDNFINLVVCAQTDMGIQAVNQRLHEIEDQNGRDRSGPRFSSRTIDLDLLLYDDEIFAEGKLRIPRDEILHNAFVLLPLSELAPGRKHPQLGKTYLELWQSFDKDSQQLWRID